MKTIVSELMLFAAVIVAGTLIVLGLGSDPAATQLTREFASVQFPFR